MTFINQQRTCVRFKSLFLEFIRFLWGPYLCTKNFRLFILNNTGSPSRNTFSLSTVPIYIQFIQVTVMNGPFWKIDFPNPILQFFQFIGSLFFPVVECTYHVNMTGIRSPFTESPAFGSTVQSKIKIARGEIRQRLFSFISQFGFFIQHKLMPAGNSVGKRFQPRIVFDKIQCLFHI